MNAGIAIVAMIFYQSQPQPSVNHGGCIDHARMGVFCTIGEVNPHESSTINPAQQRQQENK